jgi:hypothetical protein
MSETGLLARPGLGHVGCFGWRTRIVEVRTLDSDWAVTLTPDFICGEALTGTVRPP